MKKINQKRIIKILIIYSVIMILSILFTSGAAQTTQRPSNIYDISVNLINQEPDPAEPGKYVDVRIKFDNNGTGEARDVDVEILPEYPFSLDPGRHAVRSIGILQSRQRGDVGVIVKYRLRGDKNAVEGENELKVRYRIDICLLLVLSTNNLNSAVSKSSESILPRYISSLDRIL